MNGIAEVRNEYKLAARQYIRTNSEFNRGRFSGLATALGCSGVSISEIDEMCHTCEEEVKDERAQEDVGPGDVNYDEEGFVTEQDLQQLQPKLEQQAKQAFTEQEELDAIERPASQARVEADESEKGITALKMLIRKYGYCQLELEITHLRDTVMFNPQLEQEEAEQ